MPATREEQLDELLAMARNLGYLETQASAAEQRADTAPKGSTARPRRWARELRRMCESKQKQLDRCRARFMSNLMTDLTEGMPRQ